MKKSIYTVILLFLILTSSVIIFAIQPSSTEEYDQFIASGRQLICNGSFEKLGKDEQVEDWNWVEKTKNPTCVKHIIDESKSFHGIAFLDCSTSSTGRGLYAGCINIPLGKTVKTTFYAKGHGKCIFNFFINDKNEKNLPASAKALYVKSSSEFKVNSKQWQKCKAEFAIPNKFVPKNGQTGIAKSAFIMIKVIGNISIDAVSVVESETGNVKTKSERFQAVKSSKPYLTIPYLKQPPLIDGTIKDDEWKYATALTGFSCNGSDVSKNQTIIYAGFDDEKIYFAFRTDINGKPAESDKVRDNVLKKEDDIIEIWMRSPNGVVYQFLGLPNGKIMDFKSGDVAWNGKWTFANKVKDSGETKGGILTFRKTIWTGEVSISFAELGVKSPISDRPWLMNFTRDYSSDKMRTGSEWTSWSPITGLFKNTDAWAVVSFAKNIPVIQILKLGKLADNDITTTGKIINNSQNDLKVISRVASRRNNSKTIMLQYQDFASGFDDAFSISDSLQLNGAAEMYLETIVQLPRRLIYRSIVPFTVKPPLYVKLIPDFPSNRIYVNVNTKKLKQLQKNHILKVEVLNENNVSDIAKTEKYNKDAVSCDLMLDISSLEPGTYSVKVAAFNNDMDKVPVSSTCAALTVPQKPEWAKNHLGISNKVLPPWSPIQVTGDTVRITQREYKLGKMGLPAQITSLGKKLFASPPELKLVINGKKQDWKCDRLDIVSQKDTEAVWHFSGAAGNLQLSGSLKIEFDGFAMFTFDITPTEPVSIDELSLEFPFASKHVLYARAYNAIKERSYACTWTKSKPDQANVPGNFFRFSNNGWIWPEDWTNEIHLGDDQRGFAVMCETQQFLKGGKRTEIIDGKDFRTLKIILIDGPCKVKKTLHYQYAWQTTPVRPLPLNSRHWHAGYFRDKDKANGATNIFCSTADLFWGLKYECYPAFPSQEDKNKLEQWKSLGDIKVTPYFGTGLISAEEASGMTSYLPIWYVYPVSLGRMPNGKYAVVCPNAASLRDCHAYSLKKIEEMGYGGVYLDVSSATACSNHYHGCGYWSPDEKTWKPTVNVFAQRELYKRFYVINKTSERAGVLFKHGNFGTATAGFCDVLTSGEEWCLEGTKQYDRLTPEMFRAMYMTNNQYGVPFLWYAFHHYYRGVQYGGRVPLYTILTYLLPHHVLPLDVRAGMDRIWEALDPFWTESEFIPYWSEEPAAKATDSQVVCSVYLKNKTKEALLVIANWNNDMRETAVRINLARLGAKEITSLQRALSHPILNTLDTKKDPQNNGPINFSDGEIKLSLGARNLEVIKLKLK